MIARVEQDGLLAHADVAGRTTLVAGDFFAELPAGHDAYVLKWILHDWDDADTARILATCRRAVPAHGKLLIVEMLIGARNAYSLAKLSDVGMLTLTGGRERTEAEFRRLLAGAFEEAGYVVDGSHAGLYLWLRPAGAGQDSRATVADLAALGILVAPGAFYGSAGNGHVRVALTASDERVGAASTRLTGA